MEDRTPLPRSADECRPQGRAGAPASEYLHDIFKCTSPPHILRCFECERQLGKLVRKCAASGFFFLLTKWNFSQTDTVSAADGSFPTVLTCVGHHQPPPGPSKHRRSVLHLSAGTERGLGSEERFASSAERHPHRSVIRSQAPRKCLGVGWDAILCPFCSP